MKTTSPVRALILTARPKTLAAAIVPVLVGSALAYAEYGSMSWSIACLALLSAAFIQIGTNFVNDALDFEKGADTETRLGDARAAQSGWFSAKSVLWMGMTCFFIALLLGMPLVAYGGWPILIIGVVSLIMGYAYTGGPYPLAYKGLGDLFVILFFGLIAVGGVFYLQTEMYNWSASVAGLQVGMLATVLIAINNLRDREEDLKVNKLTLAVRLGPRLGRWEVVLLFAFTFGLGFYWHAQERLLAAWLPLIALPLALKVAWQVLRTPSSRDYNRYLAQAAAVHVLFGLSLGLGLFWS